MAGGEECGVTVIGSEEACLLVFATICRKVCEFNSANVFLFGHLHD
jgi:hypothetical protein